MAPTRPSTEEVVVGVSTEVRVAGCDGATVVERPGVQVLMGARGGLANDGDSVVSLRLLDVAAAATTDSGGGGRAGVAKVAETIGGEDASAGGGWTVTADALT